MSASERESIQKIKMIVSSEHEYLEKVSNRLAPTWLGFFMEVAFALGFTPSLFPFPSFFFFLLSFFHAFPARTWLLSISLCGLPGTKTTHSGMMGSKITVW